jgi:hypothetical protein
MSWEATNAVVQKSKQKGSGYLLMLLLGNHADGNGYSWYGVRRLAVETRLSQRNVRYLIRKCEALGELEVFIGQGENGTNLYRVTLLPDRSERPGKRPSPAKLTAAKIAPLQAESTTPGNRASQTPAIAVAAKSNGSINEFFRPVDESTSIRSKQGRQCTHLKCSPEGCGYISGASVPERLSKADWKAAFSGLKTTAANDLAVKGRERKTS